MKAWRCLLAILLMTAASGTIAAEPAFVARQPLRQAQSKVIKLFGAGKLGGLEAYQTGLIVSDEGHLLTIDSTVLEDRIATVVTAAGDRFQAELVGADPLLGVALLKIDPAGQSLASFQLANSSTPEPMAGEPILALANLFGIATGAEQVSLSHGVISAIAPLRVRRGPVRRVDLGEVLLLDAVTSNPGAAGGAVVDLRGRLLGMLGPESRGDLTGAWVSYALPADQLAEAMNRILAGYDPLQTDKNNDLAKSIDTQRVWGFAMVPSLTDRTPPFVDYVRANSTSQQAGLLPDDLVVMVGGFVTASCREFDRILTRQTGRGEEIVLSVQRGSQLVEISLPKISIAKQTGQAKQTGEVQP